MSNDKEVKHTRNRGRPKNPKTTAKQELYARTFVETGSRKIAKETAGYSTYRGPEQNNKIQFLIEKYKKKMETKFMDKAEEIADNLYSLAKNAKSEQVRLGASKDWLDRAGLAPVNKSEIETKKVISTESQISRELVDRLNGLKAKKNRTGK
ncbi:hypothetical protein HMPREF0872_03895 [Veillonella montpellierensis DNF00314]|uniref:Terminase n=1 Tax=Veillonella montpellierensis DNF00314 TaxID=1401067 RepID=A0A096AKB7_9FIRM|nr:hypothetical protein [Veillonella montpellierensis]KGF47548.1 hypothetical protein HMPREF0872_03895 [Veillonella montpellierensis DNF00314]